MNLNSEQLQILRHMLGIDRDDTPNPREYRDYYCASRDDPVLWEMANLGVVERYASDRYYDWYRTTDAGKAAARASQRAMLLPKPKRIYLRWLSISDVCPDLTFRDFLKKVFGWVISWTLFWCGDAVSRCMHTEFTGWLYPAYNKLMLWSSDVQDWSAANGPWEEPNVEISGTKCPLD